METNIIDSIVIGIDDANGKWLNSKFFRSKSKAFYAYNLRFGYIYKPSNDNSKKVDQKQGFPKIQRKDEICTMKLVLNEKQSKSTFQVNNADEFIATDNVFREKGYEYRLAFSSGGDGRYVTILDE